MDSNLYFYLAQFIGVIGLTFIVLSFQRESRNQTLAMHIVASIAFTFHFLMIGAATGAAMNILAGFRASFFRLREKFPILHHKLFLYSFILAFWGAGWVTFEDWTSILPIYSMSLECFSLWSQSARKMRLLFLLARPGWILYNILVISIPGMVTEGLLMSSLLISIWKYDLTRIKKD